MSVLDAAHPLAVPAHIGEVRLIMVTKDHPLPLSVSSYIHRSPAALGIRLAGGCSNMSQAERDGMLGFFASGLAGFSGLLSSGGTREVSPDGMLIPMVTDVPPLLAAQSPGKVLTISSVPRTGDLRLVGESRLVLSADHTLLPNPGVHMIIVVQSETGFPLEWDGDLDTYFKLFHSLVVDGLWKFGMVVYNGGGVTKKEAERAMMLGWPVILVEGSGRMADELVQAIKLPDFKLPDGTALAPGQVTTVQNGQSSELYSQLVAHGLIAA